MFLDIFANVIAIVVNLALGLRLLQLGREPDRAPEYLLGLCLTFDGIEWLFWLLAAYTPLIDTPLGNASGYLSRAGLCASTICLLAFNQTVFRPGRASGRAAVMIASTIMLVGLIGSGFVGDWNGYRTDLPWTWLELSAQAFAYAWTFGEAGAYYAKLRRRQAHGLSDPVLTNRLLLWCGYGGAMFGAQLMLVAAQVQAGASGRYPPLYDALQSPLTLGACVALWLAFAPPKAYRNWLRSEAR